MRTTIPLWQQGLELQTCHLVGLVGEHFFGHRVGHQDAAVPVNHNNALRHAVENLPECVTGDNREVKRINHNPIYGQILTKITLEAD